MCGLAPFAASGGEPAPPNGMDPSQYSKRNEPPIPTPTPSLGTSLDINDTVAYNLASASQAHAEGRRDNMDDFNSETDSDYTSYWRDWVSLSFLFLAPRVSICVRRRKSFAGREETCKGGKLVLLFMREMVMLPDVCLIHIGVSKCAMNPSPGRQSPKPFVATRRLRL